jgi:hypothetical protein
MNGGKGLIMNMEVQKEKDKAKQKDKFIGFYVVAFLDLLGQQDKLRKLTVLPNIDNQEEIAAFKLKIGEFYKPLYALRTFFEGSIIPFIEGGIDENELSPSDRELLQKFRSTPIFHRHFSDSLIVHIPLHEKSGIFPCRAIFGVLAATALTFLSCMIHSVALRGGIDIGLAMELEEDEIYGPAIARAYNLESRVAQYPRIVIGEDLIQYLRMISEKTSTMEEKSNAMLATRSLKLLAIDDDGYTFLDWLGSGTRTTFPKPQEQALKIYNFIIQESDTHKKNRNTKLGLRYALLRDYALSRLPDWGLSFEAENSK